jgi:hypothetical protein
MPRRAPRKGSLAQRSPSYDDHQPGRIFSLPFGCWRSHTPDSVAPSSRSSDAREPRLADAICSDKATGLVSQRHSIQVIRDGDPHAQSRRPSHSSSSSTAVTSIFTSTAPSTPSFTPSLADQYLDTMPMDDFWRALCHRKIRQKQRKLQALKRVQIISKKASAPNPPPPQPVRQYKSIHYCRRLTRLTRLKVISKPKPTRKRKSPSSDSGFISSSPPPNTSRFRFRSTRRCPGEGLMGSTIPIDTSLSMFGRSCLSCNCTNTTCWRRTLGGIICNSCGLR